MDNLTISTLNELYNLVLSKHIRAYERTFLLQAKNQLEFGQNYAKVLSELEANLRPLAIRHNLTPQVNAFYQKIGTSGLFGRGVGNML